MSKCNTSVAPIPQPSLQATCITTVIGFAQNYFTVLHWNERKLPVYSSFSAFLWMRVDASTMNTQKAEKESKRDKKLHSPDQKSAVRRTFSRLCSISVQSLQIFETIVAYSAPWFTHSENVRESLLLIFKDKLTHHSAF